MRITGTGHAGMLIETGAGSILCDPWVNPAYFASWFPFPDNSALDWDRLGNCDYLYVSHLHRDHFDAENLRRHVSKKTTVLLPEYPTSDLEDELRLLGFTSFLRARSGEPVALDGGLTVMIQALVSPTDGPPCFLDDELWQVNDIFNDEGNIFPDQQEFIDHYHGTGRSNGVILLPGTTATVTSDTCAVEQPVADVPEFFAGKEAYLRAYQQRQRPVIQAERASWAHPEVDVLGELRRRVQPLMAQSEQIAGGIGGPIRFDLTDDAGKVVERIVFDFVTREVRPAADEKVRYRFRTRRTLVEHLLVTGEVDWVNSLFLSCRFSAARIGQYNEYIYTFFKCLSEDRMQYAEAWYAGQTTDAEDIAIGDWVVQRHCPHLKANLERFARVDDDVLTCQMHGWKFDLPTGRCLTSAGHAIRARHADEVQPIRG